MSFTYQARNGKTYYLHTGPKKGGGVQHYVSQNPSKPLAGALPEGFEIYETVNAQVYLRRKKPTLVTEVEVLAIRNILERRPDPWRYKVEVKSKELVVHECNQDTSFWRELNPFISEARATAISVATAHYMAVMRFILVDEAKRLFAPERFCFRGRVDDWISIGPPDRLVKLAQKYLPHLGKESLYELY